MILTRRQLIGAGLAGGASLAGLDWAKGLHSALAAPRVCGDLRDIEHVVIFIQENRSFDHYFGTYRGVRGFADPHPKLLPDGSGPAAYLASKAEQDRVASRIWDGGAGASNWDCAAIVHFGGR